MSAPFVLTLLVLAAPPVNTREVEAVAVEPAPAPAPAPAASPAAAPASSIAIEPAPAAAPTPASSPAASPASAPPEAPGAATSTAESPPPTTPAPVAAAPPPPAPLRPIRWRLDVAVGVGGAILFDPAWRAFDRDDRRVAHQDLSVRVDFPIGGQRLFLGPTATYRHLVGRGDLHQALGTQARLFEGLLGLRAAVVLVEGADVFAQIGGGPSFAGFSFSGATSASGRATGGVVDGLAGVALSLPRRWLSRRGAARVTGGLEIAGGYSWRSRVDVAPALAGDEESIASGPAALGDVAMRGLVGRIGLFLRVL